jgi:glutamate/tyrosine decarboxylase-like PLP-dependent enzyme
MKDYMFCYTVCGSERRRRMDSIIDDFARRAIHYIDGLSSRNVFPSDEAISNLQLLDTPLQEKPLAVEDVLALLDEVGSPATVASAGGRYFGFVIGGSLPASLAANLLAGVWDQNGVLEASSPVAAKLEEICARWLVSLLGLPAGTGTGFVSGATMANFSGLAAARNALLMKQGWNVLEKGLFGAPPISVIVGDEVHVSLLKALGLLGLGQERVVRVAADNQGRMIADRLPVLDEKSIVCIQAGNVNTGAFDPSDEICERAREVGAWVHVDGAFGLWAAAVQSLAHLSQGIEKADSWAVDAHKWLNVPYDSGIVFVRDHEQLRAAMSTNAAYLIESGKREPSHYVPELSRRARGIEIWAALRSLGRMGLADLIESGCSHASLFARRLQAAGFEILNDVVLNQVLVSFGDTDATRRIIKRIQEDGTCWCGGTRWQGRTAMRISVSSWKTTVEDIEKSAAAIVRIAHEEKR